MNSEPKTIVTVIADSGFVIPVFILVLSLKFYEPEQQIHILGISLSESEKSLFTQFKNVFIFESSIPRSNKPGAMRIIADILKGEALLTAKDCEEPWIALLDGDCVATGPLSPYLAPAEPALYARSRTAEEDNQIFRYYRPPSDTKNGIPEAFLKRWQEDVRQNKLPARDTTVLSGNLILHRDHLNFAHVWQDFMKKVLIYSDPAKTDVAYYMPAEFALSAWLMFADNPPPVRDVLLNSNPNAYLAHLGPAPRYWRLWTVKKLKYFDAVIRLLDWAEKQGIEIPLLPYALKKRNRVAIVAVAYVYEVFIWIRKKTKHIYKKVAGNPPNRQ